MGGGKSCVVELLLKDYFEVKGISCKPLGFERNSEQFIAV